MPRYQDKFPPRFWALKQSSSFPGLAEIGTPFCWLAPASSQAAASARWNGILLAKQTAPTELLQRLEGSACSWIPSKEELVPTFPLPSVNPMSVLPAPAQRAGEDHRRGKLRVRNGSMGIFQLKWIFLSLASPRANPAETGLQWAHHFSIQCKAATANWPLCYLCWKILY